MSPRMGLDRETVVRAAAALADAEGPEALTLARLAARLGVRPPSLYNHLAGLDALRRELALLGLREVTERVGQAAVGRAGEDAALAVATAYRAYARARPGVYAASVRAPEPADAAWQEAADRLLAIVVAALAAFDLDGDDALHAVRGLRAVLHGFVALEAVGGFGLPLDLDESFRRSVLAYLAGLRARGTLAAGDGDAPPTRSAAPPIGA